MVPGSGLLQSLSAACRRCWATLSLSLAASQFLKELMASPACFQMALPSSYAFFHFHGRAYFTASLPASPPASEPRMLRAVSPQAPRSPEVKHLMPAVMPSSSAAILRCS